MPNIFYHGKKVEPELPRTPDDDHLFTELAERLLDLGVGEDALTMDGYDDCVMGILERFGMDPIVIYDKQMVIQKLMENGCETYEEAYEFYLYNQLGAWHGEGTPGFLERIGAT